MKHSTTQLLHIRNTQVAIVLTGGGSLFISDILNKGGASDVLVDAQVPYSKEALELYVEQKVDKFNSQDTAELMAFKAYHRILSLKGIKEDPHEGPYSVGIGVTAALGVDNQREGRINSAYISFYNGYSHRNKKVLFDFTQSRETQERILADYLHECLLVLHVKRSLNDKRELPLDNYFESFCIGQIANDRHKTLRENPFNADDPMEFFIFPGSFNPPHEGHKEIVDIVKSLIDKNNTKNTFMKMFGETTTRHFHKDPVSDREIIKRADAAEQYLDIPVLLSTGAKLEDKEISNELWFDENNKITFVVGFDVYVKIMDTPSTVEFIEKHNGRVKLLVFPRNGKIIDIVDFTSSEKDNIPLHPWTMEDSVINIKNNTSSTEIRERLKQQTQ